MERKLNPKMCKIQMQQNLTSNFKDNNFYFKVKEKQTTAH